MKKILATLVAASALILCGCGANVNENKTPEQAKTEAASMDAASLQKQVDALKAFIAEKNAEAKALGVYVEELKAKATAAAQSK